MRQKKVIVYNYEFRQGMLWIEIRNKTDLSAIIMRINSLISCDTKPPVPRRDKKELPPSFHTTIHLSSPKGCKISFNLWSVFARIVWNIIKQISFIHEIYTRCFTTHAVLWKNKISIVNTACFDGLTSPRL